MIPGKLHLFLFDVKVSQMCTAIYLLRPVFGSIRTEDRIPAGEPPLAQGMHLV
jgi:hypothetical protein